MRAVRSLSFGTTSELTVVDADGRALVLRRWDRGPLDEQDPDPVRSEMGALEAARRILGAVVPEPIAADPTGQAAGCPAVLMTLVPGVPVVHDLDVARLVEPVSRLHAATPPLLPSARPWFEPQRVEVLTWTRAPGAWSALVATLQTPPPAAPSVFLHRDYHPGNVLWTDGAVSGIVDWAAACVGPAGLDVAHTRANLALTDGPDAAARYLHAYQTLVPDYRHDQWWDAADLASFVRDDFAGVLAFNAFGAALDVDLVRARADAYARHLTNVR